MKLDKLSVLVTGASTGIGRQLALDLAARGCCITLADINEAEALKTLADVKAAGGDGHIEYCDVTDIEHQERVFNNHIARYGRLDVAILNAGIMEKGDVASSTDHSYLQTLHVDLTAVVVGANLALRTMNKTNSQGVVLMVASAGGLFPMPHAPVYAAAKAGVVHFARSIASKARKQGIRVVALCPQYTDTPLVNNNIDVIKPFLAETGVNSLMSVHQVSEAGLQLIQDDSLNGAVGFLHAKTQRLLLWPQMKPLQAMKTGTGVSSTVLADPSLEACKQWVSKQHTTQYRKVEVHQLSTDFRSATRVVRCLLPSTVPEGHVLVRWTYAGVNASDINYTAGRYERVAGERPLPWDAGFEGVGVVAATGDGVKGLCVGQPVASLTWGAFSECSILPSHHAIPVSAPSPQVLALLVSGLTASIGLSVTGGVADGSRVMVTAAAGGTGQFAVQLAKLAGATVIATCSTDEKADMLRGVGADRVINYKTEDVKSVLKAEYPGGLDVVYESVGGRMFDSCVGALSPGGRCIVIGMMEQYSGQWQPSVHPGLAEKLMWKSASVTGFFLLHHRKLFSRHLRLLQQHLKEGLLKVTVDKTRFVGVESVADAVEYLHSGRSAGKVVVQIPKQLPAGNAAAKL